LYLKFCIFVLYLNKTKTIFPKSFQLKMNHKKRTNENFVLSDLLKEFIKDSKLKQGLDAVNVKQTWENIMGKGVNAYTKEIILKKNTLYVWFSSSVLREELLYQKQKIIEMLNQEIGEPIVKDLVFR